MKKCRDCYYYDLCTTRRICRYYDPIVNIDEFNDEIIKAFLIQDKKEFVHDWNIYIMSIHL